MFSTAFRISCLWLKEVLQRDLHKSRTSCATRFPVHGLTCSTTRGRTVTGRPPSLKIFWPRAFSSLTPNRSAPTQLCNSKATPAPCAHFAIVSQPSASCASWAMAPAAICFAVSASVNGSFVASSVPRALRKTRTNFLFILPNNFLTCASSVATLATPTSSPPTSPGTGLRTLWSTNWRASRSISGRRNTTMSKFGLIYSECERIEVSNRTR